jgi:hypothetical protein
MFDPIDVKELMGPALIDELREKKVCLYLGRNQGRAPELEDFLGAVQLLGDCDTLCFAEPSRSQQEVIDRLNSYRGNPEIPIQGGSITDLHIEENWVYPFRYYDSEWEWLPSEARPDENRFWAVTAWFTIVRRGQPNRKVLLVHIGIGGPAALLCFVHPNNIKVTRIIGTP